MPIIRPLVEADAEAVQDAARESWLATYGSIYDAEFIHDWIDQKYAPEILRADAGRVAAGEVFFHVAADGDRVAGFCHVAATDEGGVMYRIYLRPAYVGRGIGSALLDAAEAWMRARGIARYRCWVHRDNALGRRFYARRGFVRRPEMDRGEDEEWCMEKPVDRVETVDATDEEAE